MNREIRVLMIAPSAVAGGMEDILLNITAGLPGMGITPDVICFQQGPLVDRLVQQGVLVQVIDAGHLRDVRRFGQTCRRLATAMRTRGVQVVFSNLPKAHLYAALPARTQHVPALWCQAGYPDPPHWTDRLASMLPAAGVIALSRDSAAAQQRLNGRHAVHMMHPGIDVERFQVGTDPGLRQRYGISAGSVVISLVGRLQPWKGQREFLQAAAVVAKSSPDAHFAIVGGAILGWEGDYPAELERLAAELGLADRVTFTGHTDDVTRWMAASDIMVNASAPEPFGLVIVEAMAAGCAVVAVASGGPRDIIEDGISGVLCATREPRELAEAIQRLLDDVGLRRDIGRAARARVEAEFTREAMADRFADIIRAVA